MNCKEINDHIETLTLATLSSGISSELKQHIEQCANCKEALQIHHAYLLKMSGVSAPELTPELTDKKASSMLNQFSRSENKNNGSFLQGFIAASVLAISVLGAWTLFNPDIQQAPTITQHNTQKADHFFTTEVVLIIHAPEDMHDADLNLVLPQQIALEGYSNIQELSWAVDLKAGANTLSLPIRVNQHPGIEQPLSIMAKLYHYAEEREFEIKVDIEKIQSQQNNSAYLILKPNTTQV